MSDHTLTPAAARELLAAIDGEQAEDSTAIKELREYVAQEAPEWPDGTHARVLVDGVWYETVRDHDGAPKWLTAGHPDSFWFRDLEVTEVRPLRVLGEGEVAVRRQEFDDVACDWRVRANRVRRDGHVTVAALAHAYADALDAEADR